MMMSLTANPGRDGVELGIGLHEGSVSRFRDDRQLEIAVLVQKGDIPLTSERGERKVKPSIDIESSPNRGDQSDARLHLARGQRGSLYIRSGVMLMHS